VNVDRFYAHTLEDQTPEKWQALDQHLWGVAELAAGFAASFDSAAWGHLAGLWHDLGKYQTEFQQRLLGSHVSVEHSGAGAALAINRNKEFGLPLAFVIAGHHAGLANLIESDIGLPAPLQERLRENLSTIEKTLPVVPGEIAGVPVPVVPSFLLRKPGLLKEVLSRRSEFWIRFLFSALVDADRLDTEAFCDPYKGRQRGRFSPVATLRQRLDSFIDSKVQGLSDSEKIQPVNLSRAEILHACRKAAALPPGILSLTVPTGGGKTLSAMSFALRHAEQQNLRRVIVVIPYTSIIEQNAGVYSDALGRENVVEHHSNLDPGKKKSEQGEELTVRHELACENWDAPVVVTTTAQFFESLFSNHPSRCRKIHNIARSVIILDEVQCLPPGFLLSIVEALSELVSDYGCTVVLSTATPPALAARERFEQGLSDIRPIVPDAKEMAERLRRVEYTWPTAGSPPMTWPQLAEAMMECQQVLAVVHRRNDARVLAQELHSLRPTEPVWHLSALMCAAHRTKALALIKEHLAEGGPCRVVSTQLVEAGVDVDFPVVYRALGGLDSIVQAGGRCNREGRLEKGRVVVFRSETAPPSGTPRQAMEVTETLLREGDAPLDPANPELFEKYFRMLYHGLVLDANRIQPLRQEFKFATVGREFKLIEDGFTNSIIVPYGEAEARLQELRQGPTRETFRALQPFVVSIYPDAFAKLSRAGALEEVTEGISALSKPYEHLYDQTFGLVVGDEPRADPAALIVGSPGG
jgi:CRISPR-associated endonuclease/helicase Cas3